MFNVTYSIMQSLNLTCVALLQAVVKSHGWNCQKTGTTSASCAVTRWLGVESSELSHVVHFVY